MSMEKVSVEAFDRTAAALIRVIREDAEIIEKLKTANAQLIEGAQKAWNQVHDGAVANGELRNKFERLLDLCESREARAAEDHYGPEDADVSVTEIREILGP